MIPFMCKTCRGEHVPPPVPVSLYPIIFNGEEIEVVNSFCYLGDAIGHRGGCYNATTARIRRYADKISMGEIS